jgi:hypothetical protein
MHAQAKVSWPGCPETSSFSMTFAPGIRPSTCTINVPAMRADPASTGELTIRWQGPTGETVSIELKDCVLEQPPVSSDGGGTKARLPIRDRRHWWQYGAISGSYNQKRADGEYLREKTPQELAELLLKAMGESGFSTSKLPNKPRPPVNWKYANPASELDRLCQSLGCIVVLNPLTNKVELWPEGEGENPPDWPAIGRSVGFSLIAPPKSITIVGEPTLFESVFYCGEPVGVDEDGSVKAIDDLSYKPADGWDATAPSFFAIEGTYTSNGERRELKDLARSSVYRMYRITGLLSGPDQWSPELLRGTDKAPVARDDIQLLTERVAKAPDLDGTSRREPPQVLLKSWQLGQSAEFNSQPKLLTSGFTIDVERRMVVLSEPAFFIDANGKYQPALVWLRTGFHAGRDGQLHCYTRERPLPKGNKNAGTRVESRPLAQEVFELWTISLDNPAQGQKAGTENNATDLDADADGQLDSLTKIYTLQTSPSARYPGIVTASCDGRIQQITWESGASGSFTTISAGSRHNPYIPAMEQQRLERDQKDLGRFLLAGAQPATKGVAK